MMLPNETLLNVLRCADFGTLVSTKFVDARFLDVVTKFGVELACRRNFRVVFLDNYVCYADVTIGDRLKNIRYEPGNQQSLAAACREVAAVIGQHAVAELIFLENTWNMPGVCAVFEDTLPLKYAEEVVLHGPRGSTVGNGFEALMRNFAGLKSLRLGLDYDVFRQLSWTFLQQKAASELRIIQVSMIDRPAPTDGVCRSVEELVRDCAALPHRLGGEALQLDFSFNIFSAALALRVIDVSKQGLYVTMRTGNCIMSLSNHKKSKCL